MLTDSGEKVPRFRVMNPFAGTQQVPACLTGRTNWTLVDSTIPEIFAILCLKLAEIALILGVLGPRFFALPRNFAT